MAVSAQVCLALPKPIHTAEDVAEERSLVAEGRSRVAEERWKRCQTFAVLLCAIFSESIVKMLTKNKT